VKVENKTDKGKVKKMVKNLNLICGIKVENFKLDLKT